jgi:xylulokinase
MAALYLGLDSSTQGLTGIVLEIEGAEKRVVFRRSLNFDRDLPQYGTRNGVLPQSEPLVATSPPLMWAEALDRFLTILTSESGLDLAQLRSISGAAQQHGSVYLNTAAGSILESLTPTRPLVDQVGSMLSRDEAPIWMDSSTSVQCTAITEAVGGAGAMQALTGSRAFERFTGPQIRKFYEREPEGYAATDRIHLVSSFLASLLIGRHAPIDHGDGSGMNLMDMRSRQWSNVAMRATAPELRRRLPDLCPPWAVVGELAAYWRERYGLPRATVVAWTGDNPASLIGVGIVDPARISISLGTSDTVFGLLPDFRVDPVGTNNVFIAPTGEYMALVCFKNGSLARERVRDAHGLDWTGFSLALRQAPPGNGGGITLPWYEPEITPPVLAPGVRRYGPEHLDAPSDIRAVVEAQMMASGLHSAWMGQRVEAIHATGGAALNHEILQVMADVHQADVYRFQESDSAALGAALRAWHGDSLRRGRRIAWEDVVAGIAEPTVANRVRPDGGNAALYEELREVYAACEANGLGRDEDPSAMIEQFRERFASS